MNPTQTIRFILLVLFLMAAPVIGAACYECINDSCDTAEQGHSGKSTCIASTVCSAAGCSYDCRTSGSSCTGCGEQCDEGDVNTVQIVPNGDNAPFATMPLLPIAKEVRGCAST